MDNLKDEKGFLRALLRSNEFGSKPVSLSEHLPEMEFLLVQMSLISSIMVTPSQKTGIK